MNVRVIYPLSGVAKSRIYSSSIAITPYYIRIYEKPRSLSIDIAEKLIPKFIKVKEDSTNKKVILPKKFFELFIDKVSKDYNNILLYATIDYIFKYTKKFYILADDIAWLSNEILEHAEYILEDIKENPQDYPVYSANILELWTINNPEKMVLYSFTFKMNKGSYIKVVASTPPIKDCTKRGLIHIRTKSETVSILSTFIFNPFCIYKIGKLVKEYSSFSSTLYTIYSGGNSFSIPLHFIFKYANLLYDIKYALGKELVEKLIDSLIEFDEKYLRKYSLALEEVDNINSIFDVFILTSLISYFPDDAIVALYLRYPDEKLFYAVYPTATFSEIKNLEYLVEGDTVLIVRHNDGENLVFLTDSTFYYLFLVEPASKASHKDIDKILFNLAKTGFAKMYRMSEGEIVKLLERFYKWKLNNTLMRELKIYGFPFEKLATEKGSSFVVGFNNPELTFRLLFKNTLWEELEAIGIKSNILYLVFTKKFMWKWGALNKWLIAQFMKNQEAISFLL